MKTILLIENPWDIEIIRLIEKGLSDKKIVEQVPFGSEYVINLRRKLKEFSHVQLKGL